MEIRFAKPGRIMAETVNGSRRSRLERIGMGAACGRVQDYDTVKNPIKF